MCAGNELRTLTIRNGISYIVIDLRPQRADTVTSRGETSLDGFGDCRPF